MQIRDSRLYRAEFKTFEEYCKGRWEMAERTANQLIVSSNVIENIGRNCVQTEIMPANEAQTRPLTKLPPKERVDSKEP